MQINPRRFQNVEAPVSVQSKTKPQQLVKQDCFIPNETGMCRLVLVLWEENIGTVKKGETYKFKMLVRKFSGVNYLSKTEESAIEHADDIGEVSTDFVQHKSTTCTQKAVSVFNNTIAMIVGYADCESSATTMEKLLQTQQLTFFINSKGTISGVAQVEKATWRSSKKAVKETLGVDN